MALQSVVWCHKDFNRDLHLSFWIYFRLYYLNGNLFCTGEKHPANTCSENLTPEYLTHPLALRNSGLTSGSNEIERNRKKLYCVEKATYDESNQRKSSTNGWSTGDDTGFMGGNCNEIEVLDNDRDQTTNQQQGRRLAPSKRYQSTWLDISQWLNGVSQNGRWQESARVCMKYTFCHYSNYISVTQIIDWVSSQ